MMKRSTRTTFAAVTFAVAACLSGGAARGEDREADAERLFREGQKLLEERRYGEACPKFEQAYKKDGQLGTLINLAFCHKEQGAVWYAWLEFREAELKAAEQNRADRRDFARQQLTVLEKSLARVVIDGTDKVSLGEVLVEDRKVPDAERGSVFAVEPGQRKVTFVAKGKKPASALVVVHKGERGEKVQHIAIPDLEDAPPEPEPAPPPPSVAPAPPPPAPAQDDGSGQRTLGWVAFGVAGAAFVTGSVTGVMTFLGPCSTALKEKSASCDEDAHEAGKNTATIATISMAIAGVAAVTGIVLFATAPSTTTTGSQGRPTSRFAITFGPGGAHGTF